MSSLRPWVALISASLIVSGCAGTNLIPEWLRSPQTAKSRPVEADAPAQDTESTPVADDPAEAGVQQVAAKENAGPAVKIGRADLLGGWKVTAGNDNCQLFMSLTGWAGGYRATTRGCSANPLVAVQAWSLNGEEVALLNGSGETVVRLIAAEKTRLNGRTGDGLGVLVFR